MRLEIVAGNRLLSEYMNLKKDGDVEMHKHPLCDHSCAVEDLLYDCAWEWIMAVVDKVESERVTLLTGDDEHTFEVWIDGSQCSLEWYTGNATGTLLQGDTAISSKIGRLWDLLVRFAMWYNGEVEKP